MKTPYIPVSCSFCSHSNNPVLQWCLRFCSTSSELLVIKQVTPFLCGVSVIFRIKGRVFSSSSQKKQDATFVSWSAKKPFGQSLPLLAPRGCSALSSHRMGCRIPPGCATRSSAMQDWGASLGFSNTSWLQRSLQTGRWKREQVVSLCPISGRKRGDFHLSESNFQGWNWSS